MDDHHRLCGQAVIDFANAESTDEACSKHFENMARLMVFRERFLKKVKGVFPFLAILPLSSELEGKCLGLMVAEEMIQTFLGDQFGKILGRPLEYNYRDGTVTMKHSHIEGARWTDGEPDVSFSSRIHHWEISELKKYCRDELGQVLKHNTFEQLDRLMSIGKDIESMKTHFTEERFAQLRRLADQHDKITSLHNEIGIIQNGLKNILNSIPEGVSFSEIPGMPYYMARYNNLPQSKVIDYGDFLSLRPGIDEHDYLEISEPGRWVDRLQRDLAYCLITFFLNRRVKEYLHKCEECEQHFLARKVYVSKNYFCSDKCRLTWNNRRRIESGEAREYKKRGRSEGKYQ